MAETFDPYLQWLGIRDPQRPPNFYRLLGLELFESDPDVITNAVDRQMAHVRNFQAGKHSAASQRILNELAAAKLCLLNADRKAQYDLQLQAQQAALQASPAMAGAAGPAGLWPLAGATPAAAEPSQSDEETPSSEPQGGGEHGSPWFSIVAASLVAMILILSGLIVMMSVQNRGRESEPSLTGPEQGEPAGPETGPKPEPKPEPEPGTKPEPKPGPKPEPKPGPKPHPEPEPKPKPKPLPPALDSIRAARAALAARDVEAARQHLDLAVKASPPPSDEATEAARLTAMASALETFWKMAALAMQQLKPGDKVTLGGASGDVVAVSPDVLVVNVGGEEKRLTLKDLPGDLAMTLAGRKLPDDSTALVPKGAFLVFDPAGDLAVADRLAQDATQQNAAAAEDLAEELKLAHVARGGTPLVAKPKPKSDRLAVPAEAEQQKALAVVKEVFAKEYAAALKPEDKGKLARNLLTQGLDTKDNPTARYVLLVEAGAMAMDAGDRDLWDRAMRGLAKYYEVDLADLAAESFTDAAKHTRSSNANKAMAQAALDLAKAASAQDHLDQAAAILEAAIAMARKAGDLATVKKAVAAKRQIEDLKQRFQAFAEAGKTLEKDPDDPQANLVRGSYMCFAKDDWTGGLPFLAKGSDPALKSLAQAELAAPQQATERVALADKWWDAAEAAGDDDTRERYRARAGYWYQKAKPDVTGLTKTKVQKRLDELNQ